MAANPGLTAGAAASRVTGVGVPFGQLSALIAGTFREQFDPHAFDEQAAENWSSDDYPAPVVQGLFQHQGAFLLASVKAGTMSLTLTPRALLYSMNVPASLAYVRELIESGDLAGASIGFEALETDWTRGSDGTPIRTVLRARLIELSIVGLPAYPQTSAAIASGPQRSMKAPTVATRDNRRTLAQARRRLEHAKHIDQLYRSRVRVLQLERRWR